MKKAKMTKEQLFHHVLKIAMGDVPIVKVHPIGMEVRMDKGHMTFHMQSDLDIKPHRVIKDKVWFKFWAKGRGIEYCCRTLLGETIWGTAPWPTDV